MDHLPEVDHFKVFLILVAGSALAVGLVWIWSKTGGSWVRNGVLAAIPGAVVAGA